MIQWTLVGDLHAKPDNLDKVQHVFKAVESRGNRTVWLGDLLHTKEWIRGRCLNFLIDSFSRSKLQHIVLCGNHDFYNSECKEHSLESLKLLPNVLVVDRPTQVQLFKGETGLTNDPTEKWVGLLPYYHDHDAFKVALEELKRQKNPIVFMHQGITSFDYGNGYIAENEVPLAALKGIPFVVSGHFHKYQVQENLCYLGTPFSQDFGESNQTKYIGEMSFELNPDNSLACASQLIELGLPRHVTLTLNCDDNVIETDEEYRPQDYVRVILTGSEEAVKRFDRSQFPNFKYIERPMIVDQLGPSVISETDSNDVKFQKWGSQVKGLSEDVLKLGLDFLRRVA